MDTEGYESKQFTKEMWRVWTGLRPLYQQLHAYVRHRLYHK